MTWQAAGIVSALIAAQTAILLYLITDLKSDINRRFTEVTARIERLEEHLFPPARKR